MTKILMVSVEDIKKSLRRLIKLVNKEDAQVLITKDGVPVALLRAYREENGA